MIKKCLMYLHMIYLYPRLWYLERYVKHHKKAGLLKK